MTDLPDRILEAIAQTARTATCACGKVHPQEEPVLRRCEADKRTVELHVPNSSVIADCPYVDAGGNPVPPCKHCKWSWPCPDLLGRAAAWDVEAS